MFQVPNWLVFESPCGAQTLPMQELLHVDNRNLRPVNFSSTAEGCVVPLPQRDVGEKSICKCNCVTFIYFFQTGNYVT